MFVLGIIFPRGVRLTCIGPPKCWIANTSLSMLSGPAFSQNHTAIYNTVITLKSGEKNDE